VFTIVFLGAMITGSDSSPSPHGTVALFAQQEDERDQNYYANAHPYLEQPIEKLIKHLPKLKKLRPADDQEALPEI
jgi:hypothetical protein